MDLAYGHFSLRGCGPQSEDASLLSRIMATGVLSTVQTICPASLSGIGLSIEFYLAEMYILSFLDRLRKTFLTPKPGGFH